MVSHCDLFLCWCCWLFTRDNSLCFISLGTLLATFCGCIECLCVCLLAHLWDFCEAFCIMSHCDLFLCWCCWFLTRDNSLCFISLGTLLEACNYSLWLYWVFTCVFSCIALHLGKAFCIVSHCDLFLCCCCSCSFSLMVLIKPVACHLIEVKGADRYTVTSVFNRLN